MANDYKQPIVVAYPIENHPADSRVNIDDSGTIQTLTSRMGTGGGNVPMILEVFRQTGFADYEQGIGTLRASGGDLGGGTETLVIEVDERAYCMGNGQLGGVTMAEISNSLDCMHDQQAIVKPVRQQRKYVVRRLTPLECCRLQGFPDWWEDGVQGSDSARYKMWGNGMALPNMLHVMRGIKRLTEEEA